MNNLVSKTRDLIEDNLKTVIDPFTYTTSKVFTLSESNPDSTTIVVYKNQVLVDAANYTFSTTTNKLTFGAGYSMVAGDAIEIDYSAYRKYSSTELKGYIRAAIGYLSVEKYGDFLVTSDTINPDPTIAERHLIAMIASILIKKTLASFKTPELTIQFTSKETVEDKIKKLIRNFNPSFGVLDYHELVEYELIFED